MSASWPPQGGQPFGGAIKHNNGNRPPICFNCNQEGHFMVACPQGPQPNTASSAFNHPQQPPYQQYPGPPALPPQNFVPQPGPVPYQPYQQNQPFNPPAPQFAYQQQQQPAPHSYRPPPAVVTHFGNPTFQGPAYSQFSPSSGPPQYGGLAPSNPPQNYGPPQAVAPYQAPPASYPPQNGYCGNYGVAAKFPQPQWNNPPPVPVTQNAPVFQRSQRKYSDSSYSGTPGFQPQPPHTLHDGSRNGSHSHQQTPQTPSSNLGSIQQPTPKPAQNTQVAQSSDSKQSSRASTPYGRHDSEIGDILKELKRQSGGFANNGETTSTGMGGDGEQKESEEEAQQFNWDFKYIFKEPAKQETVALAQPLSTDLDITPVPLLDPRPTNSISRYARKDNLKEFTRSIRNAPQWSFLQEDPAFSGVLDGPLIPINEVQAWIAARHRTQASNGDTSNLSRKRAHSDEEGEMNNEQDDVDHQIALEAAVEMQSNGPPSKRQKNDVEAQSTKAVVTTHVTTPIFDGRGGTPCLATDDDAWAPQPGEGAASATSIEDPTEARLAALGVTDEMVQTPLNGPSPSPFSNQSMNQGPPANQLGIAQPVTNGYNNIQGPQPQFQPPPNTPYGSQQNRPPQFGSPANPSYVNGQQYQPQFGPPANPPYQSGNPMNAGYGNPPYGGSSFTSYSPGPSGPPQRGNVPYGPPTNPQYFNGPPVNGQYNADPSNYQPQYNTTVTQNSPYNGQPYGQVPQYNNGPTGPYENQLQGNPQYGNGPPVQPPYVTNPQSNPPFRQDSGYASARGSYSNGSAPNGFNPQPNSQPTPQIQPKNETNPSQTDQPKSEVENVPPSNIPRSDTNSPDQGESPLSPTSAEILGKLVQPSRKASNGRKIDLKRPAPVVAEAYR
ncbi:hypothetical protein G7Y89_g5850 [Cudoniella acicularis]|uniref:CCHC-type domain-containing protein n=1 Tax=Cudoniella acicularis TaxID=354080 RepID=A0A8H4RN36_9HELO|nr:hypothetical protein G7Y89_g5850 [Cudoniella acicularis]